MKRVRINLFLLMAGAAGIVACGGASKPQGHGTEAESAVTAPPPPTPDTSPIQILRTPAGLALRPEAPPVTGTPAPGPNPVGTPAAGSP